MTSDEMERAIIDLTKRMQSLENREQMRQKTQHYPPPRALSRDKERPGTALGVDTSLGHYAEFNEDDCA